MKITYWGHSCFAITSDRGLRVVLDPYSLPVAAGSFYYEPLKLSANLVTLSHHHWDHAGVKAIGGSPRVIDEPGPFSFGELTGLALPSEHDAQGGRERGPNLIFRLELDGLRLAHFGDFGQAALRPEQERELRNLDLLLLPVGGKYTIDGRTAAEIVQKLKPRCTIPMHYGTPVAEFLAPVETFLQYFPGAERADSPDLDPTTCSRGTVLVLPYAHLS